jgi:hypothetical protein
MRFRFRRVQPAIRELNLYHAGTGVGKRNVPPRTFPESLPPSRGLRCDRRNRSPGPIHRGARSGRCVCSSSLIGLLPAPSSLLPTKKAVSWPRKSLGDLRFRLLQEHSIEPKNAKGKAIYSRRGNGLGGAEGLSRAIHQGQDLPGQSHAGRGQFHAQAVPGPSERCLSDHVTPATLSSYSLRDGSSVFAKSARVLQDLIR